MPVCASCGKPTRVKHKIVDGKKFRVCQCGEILETKKIKEEKKAKASVRKRKKEEAEKIAAPEIRVPEHNTAAAEATVAEGGKE